MIKDLIIEPTPEAVFYHLHQFVQNYDADGQADLFAEDGVWEFPFAPAGIPKQVKGRENIRTTGRMGMEKSKQSGRRIIGYNEVHIHKTEDPTVIIVEFQLQGEVTSTQTGYVIPYVQLLKVEKGQIVLLRDYFPGDILKTALQT